MKSRIIFLIICLSILLMGASGCSDDNSSNINQNDTNLSAGQIINNGANPINENYDVSMEVSQNKSIINISNHLDTVSSPVSSEEEACTIASEKISRELKELGCTAVNKDNAWTVLYECTMGSYCAGMMILDASNGRIVANLIY